MITKIGQEELIKEAFIGGLLKTLWTIGKGGVKNLQALWKGNLTAPKALGNMGRVAKGSAKKYMPGVFEGGWANKAMGAANVVSDAETMANVDKFTTQNA